MVKICTRQGCDHLKHEDKAIIVTCLIVTFSPVHIQLMRGLQPVMTQTTSAGLLHSQSWMLLNNTVVAIRESAVPYFGL